jgi:flagellar FliJ protein
MRRSSRLATLLKIEEAKEREEARAFAELKRLLNEKLAKLTELEAYLREYHQRFADLTRNGTQAGQLRSSYDFICQLSSGISQQQIAVSESELDMEESRRRWMEAKQRVDILQKTIDKMVAEEGEKERKMEQSITDEAAQRKFHQS